MQSGVEIESYSKERHRFSGKMRPGKAIFRKLAGEKVDEDAPPLLREDFFYKPEQTILTYMLEDPFWLWHAKQGTTWETLRYVAPAALKAVHSRFKHKKGVDQAFDIPADVERLPLDETFFRLLAKTRATTGGAYEQNLVNAIFPLPKRLPQPRPQPVEAAPVAVQPPVPEPKPATAPASVKELEGASAKRRRKRKRKADQSESRLGSVPRVFAAELAAGGLDMRHMRAHHQTHFDAIYSAYEAHRLSEGRGWSRNLAAAATVPRKSDLENFSRLVTLDDINFWSQSHRMQLSRPVPCPE